MGYAMEQKQKDERIEKEGLVFSWRAAIKIRQFKKCSRIHSQFS